MDISRYNYYKKNYPEWSDEQIWTAISIDMKSADVVRKKGGDIDINDEEILRSILRGAKEWLHSVLPEIFSKVQKFLDDLIDNIATWIKRGLDYIRELIGNFFE